MGTQLSQASLETALQRCPQGAQQGAGCREPVASSAVPSWHAVEGKDLGFGLINFQCSEER